MNVIDVFIYIFFIFVLMLLVEVVCLEIFFVNMFLMGLFLYNMMMNGFWVFYLVVYEVVESIICSKISGMYLLEEYVVSFVRFIVNGNIFLFYCGLELVLIRSFIEVGIL